MYPFGRTLLIFLQGESKVEVLFPEYFLGQFESVSEASSNLDLVSSFVAFSLMKQIIGPVEVTGNPPYTRPFCI